jgi:uncharacterized protein (DUF433 family)
MNWRDRIVADPEILAGKPAIRGTDIAVEQVVGLLASGRTEDRIVADFPKLATEDVRACLAYAAELLQFERVYTRPLPTETPEKKDLAEDANAAVPGHKS